jgi:hypothetical protein
LVQAPCPFDWVCSKQLIANDTGIHWLHEGGQLQDASRCFKHQRSAGKVLCSTPSGWSAPGLQVGFPPSVARHGGPLVQHVSQDLARVIAKPRRSPIVNHLWIYWTPFICTPHYMYVRLCKYWLTRSLEYITGITGINAPSFGLHFEKTPLAVNTAPNHIPQPGEPPNRFRDSYRQNWAFYRTYTHIIQFMHRHTPKYNII